MNDKYFVESDTYKGKRIEYWSALQKAKPNSIATSAHIQETVEFIYIIKGSYTAYINQNKYELNEGDLLAILSREIHSAFSGDSPENEYFVVKTDPFLLYNQFNPSPYKIIMPFKLRKDSRKYVWKKDELAGSEIQATLNEIINEYKNPRYASELFSKVNCIKLMAYILCDWNNTEHFDNDKSSADATTLIYKSLEYIHNNYSKDITANDCAREIGLSYSYFSRQFSKTVGKSFREYLNKVRCNHAETALATTDKAISEIAYDCGYNDICYFIRIFKLSRGMTPNKFRKNYLK